MYFSICMKMIFFNIVSYLLAKSKTTMVKYACPKHQHYIP